MLCVVYQWPLALWSEEQIDTMHLLIVFQRSDHSSDYPGILPDHLCPAPFKRTIILSWCCIGWTRNSIVPMHATEERDNTKLK